MVNCLNAFEAFAHLLLAELGKLVHAERAEGSGLHEHHFHVLPCDFSEFSGVESGQACVVFGRESWRG